MLGQPPLSKKSYIAAEYDTIYEEVKVKDAYYKLVHHPPVLDTILESVTIRERSKILRENWKKEYDLVRKADADSIPGRWVGIKDTACTLPNPKDCLLQIWIPDSPEYDVKIYNNYLGATWDEDEIEAIVIQVPKIVEIKPERVERIYVPAEYLSVPTYVLKKRARRMGKKRSSNE